MNKSIFIFLLCMIVLTSCRNQTPSPLPKDPGSSDLSGFSCSLGYHSVCMQGQGVYFFPNISDDLPLLYYWDTVTGVCVPLCGKANCSHSDETCDAFFGSRVSPDTLQLSEGYIYLWNGGSGTQTLIRSLADGSAHETVCTISTGGQGVRRSIMIGDVCYVDVYYLQDEKGSDVEGLFEVQLTTGEITQIAMSNEASDWLEHRLEALYYEDDSLYYQITEYRSGEARSRFYAYQCRQKESHLLYETDHAASIIKMNDSLISYEYMYSGMEHVEQSAWRYAPDEKSKEALNIPFGYLTWDGQYLYIASPNSPVILVLDEQFRIVREFSSSLNASAAPVGRHTAPDFLLFTQEYEYDEDQELVAFTCQLFPKTLITESVGKAYEITVRQSPE